MGGRHRILALVWIASLPVTGAAAQEMNGPRRAYFEAVAGFFKLPPSEVGILGDWEIPAEEIPAVLFVANHGGVSPEAIVALRRSGRAWSDLLDRYRIGPAALHVPVRDQAPTGSLSRAYAEFRTVPVGEWPSVRLTDQEVVALVNVRVIAQTLRLPAEEVIRQTGSAPTYVELFARLRR